MYKNEKEMYPHVSRWLKNVLIKKFPNADVIVEDTSKRVLSKWLFDQNLHKYFKDYQSYEIEVDITGVAKGEKEVHMVFVECKLDKITLKDLSQLLGYSRVASPSLSLILSPKGISDSMNVLLNIFRRYDILRYNADRHIIIGRWNYSRAEPDIPSLIPKNAHRLF